MSAPTVRPPPHQTVKYVVGWRAASKAGAPLHETTRARAIAVRVTFTVTTDTGTITPSGADCLPTH